MADLFAEQIITTITAGITGLSQTGSNVGRNLVWTVDRGSLPYLSISQGVDSPINDLALSNINFIDRDISINIRVYCEFKGVVETLINQIYKEVYIALMGSSQNLGLSFVHWIRPGDFSGIELSEGAVEVATADMEFIVRYRHSLTDPSQ